MGEHCCWLIWTSIFTWATLERVFFLDRETQSDREEFSDRICTLDQSKLKRMYNHFRSCLWGMIVVPEEFP